MRRLAILALLASCLQPAQAADCPQPLRIGFFDNATPPILNGYGSRFADPPGWQVEAVQRAWQHLGCPAQLRRLPARRLLAELISGELDFALFLAATPERLGRMAFPLDAAGQPDAAWASSAGHLMLYGPPGTRPDPRWTGGALPKDLRVGVMQGSVQANLARQRGWTLEYISADALALPMLKAGRFDVLLNLREQLTAAQRAPLVEWAPAVEVRAYYAPASLAFAQRHPAWARAFWQQLCQEVRLLAPDYRPQACGSPLAGAH